MSDRVYSPLTSSAQCCGSECVAGLGDISACGGLSASLFVGGRVGFDGAGDESELILNPTTSLWVEGFSSGAGVGFSGAGRGDESWVS